MQGVPAGMAMARAVAADPAGPSSHLLLPATLAAVPLGLSCAGVGRALGWGAGWRPAVGLAAALGAVAASAMLTCLAGIPLGKVWITDCVYLWAFPYFPSSHV